MPDPPIRVAFVLPGRVKRGAETAFPEVARAMAQYEDIDVELFATRDDVPEGLKSHGVGLRHVRSLRSGLRSPSPETNTPTKSFHSPVRGAELGTAIHERVIAEGSWKAQAAKYRNFICERLGQELPADRKLAPSKLTPAETIEV